MKNLLMILAVTFSFTIVNAQNSVKTSENAQSVSVTGKKECTKSKKECSKSKKECEKSKKECSKSKAVSSKKSCSKSEKKSCSKTCTGSQAAYSKLVSPNEFHAYMDRFPMEQVIDIRTASEFKNGHIEGAKNIDFYGADFKEEINKLDKNVAIMVYCKSGNRSAKSASLLKEWGFKKIYDMDGGYLAFNKSHPNH